MKIFTYKKIYKAYLQCRENKRSTINALRFEINLENNLEKLLDELKNNKYRPGRSICFVVTEPCAREIFAADFRDRVVHHLFVNELIAKAEKMFIFDSYACRKNKGTHKAVKRLSDFIKLETNNYKKGAWFMKMDIQNFFMSIDRQTLYMAALELIDKHKETDNWKADIAELAGIIIFHDPKSNYIRKGNPALSALVPTYKSLLNQPADKGLPIGNYSSQFFANLYMNKLDHYIKRRLKCKFYIRYVDDLVLLSRSNEKLKENRDKINLFLEKTLNLKLNRKKTIVQPINKGIDFLGYFLKNNKIHPRRNVTGRYRKKLYKAAIGINEIPWRKLRSIAASYQGHIGYF